MRIFRNTMPQLGTIKHVTQSQFSFTGNFLSFLSGSENFDLMQMMKESPTHIHLPIRTCSLNTGTEHRKFSICFVL